MPHSTQAYSAAELVAYGSDHLIVVGHNTLRDATILKWTTTGTEAGDDETCPYLPASAAYDGSLLEPTRIYVAPATVIFLNIAIPPSVLDTICLAFLRAFPSSEVLVQIANDGAFTSGVTTFAGPFTSETGIPRIVRSWNGTRYIDVEHVRIRFTIDSGQYTASTLPKLVECFLGRGRVLSLGWAPGSDIERMQDDAADVEVRSGDTTRYVKYRGKHAVRHSQVLSSQSLLGLDDVATARAWASESNDYHRPVLYIPRPFTLVETAMVGLLPEGGLVLEVDDFDNHRYRFDFDELPMFRGLED